MVVAAAGRPQGPAQALGARLPVSPVLDLGMFNLEVVQVSLEEIEEQRAEVEGMTKRLQEMKSDHEFALHRKDIEWENEMKRVNEEKEVFMTAEQSRFNELQKVHDEMKSKHWNDITRKQDNHIKVMQELENQYEFKLSMEMERYDKLSEEIESIQQRCEGLLEAHAQEHEARVREHEAKSKRIEKELKLEIDRLQDDAKHNEQAFNEVLNQQEQEYEKELQQLMEAAQVELSTERQNTNLMRKLVQARSTKIAQLDKKMDELKMAAHMRDVMLSADRVKNEKLEATLEHFKRHLKERESTLEDKEKGILELRRKNVTLDNFRFVLDHRVHQLMEERGPITEHIEGLEGHIDAMYEELEREYQSKQVTSQHVNAKDMKIRTLAAELSVLRSGLREKESYITSFKRDLSSLVNLTVPKDIEDAVKDAYHRYVKDEPPRQRGTAQHMRHRRTAAAAQMGGGMESHGSTILVSAAAEDEEEIYDEADQGNAHGGNDTLAGDQPVVDAEMSEALKEAYQQRDCVQRQAQSIKRKLRGAKDDSARRGQRQLGENSTLMKECNELRKENLTYRRKVDHLQQVINEFTQNEKKRMESEAQRTASNSTRRPATAGSRMTPHQQQHSQQQQHEAGRRTDPLMTVKRVQTPAGDEATVPMLHPAQPRRGKPHAHKLSAMNSSKRVSELRSQYDQQSLNLVQNLDENQRIIDMQRMEINQLRQRLAEVQQRKEAAVPAARGPRFGGRSHGVELPNVPDTDGESSQASGSRLGLYPADHSTVGGVSFNQAQIHDR